METNDTMKALEALNSIHLVEPSNEDRYNSPEAVQDYITGLESIIKLHGQLTALSAVGPDVEVIKGDALMAAATDTSFITCLDSIEWTIDYLKERGLLARQVEEIAGLEEAIHAADSTGVFGITGWAHIIMDAARRYLAMMKVNDQHNETKEK